MDGWVDRQMDEQMDSETDKQQKMDFSLYLEVQDIQIVNIFVSVFYYYFELTITQENEKFKLSQFKISSLFLQSCDSFMRKLH